MYTGKRGMMPSMMRVMMSSERRLRSRNFLPRLRKVNSRMGRFMATVSAPMGRWVK